jgi:hypothetical protein
MDTNSMTLLRIRFIDQFLKQGGGSLEDMKNFVNDKVDEAGYKPIKDRSLNYALQDLRSGNFTHSLSDKIDPKQKDVFKIEFKNEMYQYACDSLRPVFGDLEEDERLTVPFLMGILKQYESLPAVKKIMEGLVEQFELDNTESKCASVVISSQPKLVHEDKVVKLAIQILGHIQRGECIHFHYITVNKLDTSIQKATEQKVAPMQIRLYNGIYYLTAINLEKKSIINFRIDQIRNGRIDELLNEKEECVTFNYKKLEKETELKTHFDHVLGVWNHPKDDTVTEVKIKFKDWAASYVKSLPIHPTQKIHEKSIDLKENSLVVSIQIKLAKKRFKEQKANERSIELAFLLGRFRECCEVLN